MNIGDPKREFEIQPVTEPVPGALPVADPGPASTPDPNVEPDAEPVPARAPSTRRR